MTLHFPLPRIRRHPGAHSESGQTQRLQARVDDLTKRLDQQTAINADISRRLRVLEARDANTRSVSELPQHISTVASPQAKPEPVAWRGPHRHTAKDTDMADTKFAEPPLFSTDAVQTAGRPEPWRLKFGTDGQRDDSEEEVRDETADQSS